MFSPAACRPPTEAAEGLAGDLSLVGGDRSDLDGGLTQQQLQFGTSGVTLAAFDNAALSLRLIPKDRDNGRGVEHHHHIPLSS